jgi:multiple sugar transport system ATP-binding protein
VAEVRWERVTKRFGDVVAVNGVDLTVADREFMVLLGPSGCGKSTLLRLVAGLEHPSEGHVWIGDRTVDQVPARERDVAMVFQSYALYPHKSVFANIEFPLKARKVAKADRRHRTEQAAAALGLSDLLDRKPAALSGGQRQRVALARAMVRQPAVFCMDEPLSNLDAKLRADTRAELVALHRRLDATFIYVTHDQVEAMTMGTKVAVMSQGAVQQVGTPDEVYHRPATVFVAEFVGTPAMNVFPAGAFEPGVHRVGVRPERLRFSATGPVAATVSLIERLGHDVIVTCELRTGERVQLRHDVESLVTAEPGDQVMLDADVAHRHRFDAITGRRLDTGVVG